MTVKCAGCGMFVEKHNTHIHEVASVDSMSIEALASLLHVPAEINAVRAALVRVSETSNVPKVEPPVAESTPADLAALAASFNRPLTEQAAVPAPAKPPVRRTRKARVK